MYYELESVSLIKAAKDFATLKHEGQFRKYTGEPYIVHPEAVANKVQGLGFNAIMVAAAWMHDLIEDTNTTRQEIAARFGDSIGWLVFELTNRSIYAMDRLPRRDRKLLDAAALSKASGAAQTIKVADLIDNSASIIKHDSKFAKVFIREMEYLLDVMTLADQRLVAEARTIVTSYRGI